MRKDVLSCPIPFTTGTKLRTIQIGHENLYIFQIQQFPTTFTNIEYLPFDLDRHEGVVIVDVQLLALLHQIDRRWLGQHCRRNQEVPDSLRLKNLPPLNHWIYFNCLS